jgi:magnesium chelatase subunit I
MTTENLQSDTLPIFPFTAIVGQEEMKLSLQLNVIDPKIGGVIIMGDRELVNQQQLELLQIYYQKLKS